MAEIDATLRQDRILLAITAILTAALGLSLSDALIKMMSTGFVLWQIFVLRSLLLIPVLILLIRRFTPDEAWLNAPLWSLLRSLLLVFMWVAYYPALTHIPLGLAAACLYLAPLFITLLAGLFLKEQIGARGWLAVVLGFLGVMLVLRPAGQGFSPYALLPVLAALLYAAAMILTRSKCRAENPLMLTFLHNVTFLFVGLCGTGIAALLPGAEAGNPFLWGSWSVMTPQAWAAMAVLAVGILAGSLGASLAYQNGPPAMVSTFDFSYIGFAVLWGLIFFGERPDGTALLGMGMVVAAGLMAVLRRGSGAA